MTKLNQIKMRDLIKFFMKIRYQIKILTFSFIFFWYLVFVITFLIFFLIESEGM